MLPRLLLTAHMQQTTPAWEYNDECQDTTPGTHPNVIVGVFGGGVGGQRVR